MADQLSVSMNMVNAVKARQPKKEKKSGTDDQAAFGQALSEAHAATQGDPAQEETQPKTEAAQPVSGQDAAVTATDQAVQGRIVRADAVQQAAGVIVEGILPETAGVPGEAAAEVPTEGMTADMAVQTLATATDAEGAAALPEEARDMLNTGSEDAEAAALPTAVTDGAAKMADSVRTTDDTSVDVSGIVVNTPQEDGQGAQVQERQTEHADGFQTRQMRQEDKKTEDADAGYETVQHMTSSETRAWQTSGTESTSAEEHVTESGELREEYADMLKAQIARQVADGKQELEISLTPKNLGNLIIRAAQEEGRMTVSIICSDERAMKAMAQKAAELGQILENRMGVRTEVYVDDGRQQSYLQKEGRGDNAGGQEQSQSERHRRRQEHDTMDFLQQLRLGLV